MQALGIQLEPVDEVAAEGRRSRLVMGQQESTVFVGWSMNLQGNRAGRFGLEIAERVRAELAAVWPHRPDPESDHLPRGLVLRSTGELRERLEQWARSSSAVTIGEAGSYAGRPWMVAEIGPERVTLNADTTRAAVLAFLAFDDAIAWAVVANRRGRVNRVVYRTDDDLEGWYCYLPRGRDAAGPLQQASPPGAGSQSTVE